MICELFGKTVTYKDGIAVVDTFKNANYILKNSSTWNFLREKLDAFNPDYKGKTYHVAQNVYNADDNNEGSMEYPFKTIAAASAVAKAGDTVIIHEGTYRETLTPLNSGSASAPIVYRAASGEDVTVSALDKVESAYTPYDLNGRTDVVVADLEYPLTQGKNMIFYGTDALVEGRHPDTSNANPTKAAALNLGQLWPAFGSIIASGESSNKLVSFKGDLDAYPDNYWVGATYVGEKGSGWTLSTAKVTESKAPVAATEDTQAVSAYITVSNTSTNWWYGNAEYNEEKNFGYLTGHINTVDKAGEWYVDDVNKKLYICLPDGETKDSLKLEYKVRPLVFDLRGKDNIIIDGIRTVGGGITMHGGDMNVINNCDLNYISHYTWSDDQRDGFIDNANTRNKTAAPARGEVGVYMDGENCVVANSRINYSAASAIYSAGSYALIENNYITDCGYMGSYVAGINMEAPGWKGSDKDYKHGGEHIYKNTVRRAGRAVMNIANVGDTGGDYITVLPFDICYNDLSDGLIYNRDGGVVYEHGVFVGTDIKRAKMHHNAVSNQWHGQYTPSAAIYHDNLVSYQETYDNLIFQNNGYGFKPMVYTQDRGIFPTSYATAYEWGNGRISSSENVQFSDIDYNMYPGGRPFQVGSSLEKGIFTYNYENRFSESEWYSPQGELSGDSYVTFENVDFGNYSNVLNVYFTGDKYNTGDIIDVVIGSSLETGKVIKTTVRTATTELDYNFSVEIPVGRIYGVNNVYIRGRDYKSLGVERIRPYYKENSVYTVERLYGGEYDEAIYTRGEATQVTVSSDSIHTAVRNTYQGNILKYENVDITADFNKIAYSAAVPDSHAGVVAKVYFDSLDSTPITEITVESTGAWDKYVKKEITLGKTFEKGVHDVYIKFFTADKTCNWYYLSFIDDNASDWYSPEGTLSQDSYVTFENVDFSDNRNALTLEATGSPSNTGDVIEVIIGDSVDSGRTVKTTVTATDNGAFTHSFNIGKMSGVKNVYVRAVDYKSLNIIRLCPYYKEGAVLNLARLYGGESDEVTAGGATPVATKRGSHYYINNTVKGTILKYEDIEFMTDFDTIRWNCACPKSQAPLQAEVYFDSLDSEPIATVTIESTGGWSTFVTQTLELSESVGKGTHDVYVKFITQSKTCNFYWIDFVC